MSESLVISLLSILAGGLPLMVVGYQIAFKNKVHWINGVDLSKLSNPKAFAKAVGHSILWTGVLIILVAVLLFAKIISPVIFAVAVAVVSLLPLPIFFGAKRKFS